MNGTLLRARRRGRQGATEPQPVELGSDRRYRQVLQPRTGDLHAVRAHRLDPGEQRQVLLGEAICPHEGVDREEHRRLLSAAATGGGAYRAATAAPPRPPPCRAAPPTPPAAAPATSPAARRTAGRRPARRSARRHRFFTRRAAVAGTPAVGRSAPQALPRG